MAAEEHNSGATQRFSYGPFGESATAIGHAFRFTGRRIDDETGLCYCRARMYSPQLGRFMQTDPIGYEGGLNLYAYVNNDPLSLVDPMGLTAALAGGGGSWGLSSIAHGVLTAASFCPSVCGSIFSAIEGGLYLAEGDRVGAGIAFAAAAIGTVSDAGAVSAALKAGRHIAGGGGKGIGKALVDLTEHRASHILCGHRSGASKPGKTEFPASWSDQQILHHVSDVATDPKAITGVGKWNSPYTVGTRDGVTLRVDFYPPTHPKYAGKISTAYPWRP